MLLHGAQRSSALLAAVALVGLVVTPLVHAEQHVHEAEDEQGDHDHDHGHEPGDVDAHGADADEEDAEDHDHQGEHRRHGHSHGSGPHGTNALQHLGVALLVAAGAALPPHFPPPRVSLPPEHVQRHLIPDYLAPDRAQGPPIPASL